MFIHTFYIDNTPPKCEITGLPEDWTTSATLKASGRQKAQSLKFRQELKMDYFCSWESL